MKKWLLFFLVISSIISCNTPDFSRFLLILSDGKRIDDNEVITLLQSKDYTESVKISNYHEASDLLILKIESPDPRFCVCRPGSTEPEQFPLTIPKQQSREFSFSAGGHFSESVTITYSYENIEYERTVSVKSQNDEGNDSENPVSGGIRITEPANGRIDFGKVNSGQIKDITIRMENTAKSEATVSLIYFQAADDVRISENGTDFGFELENVVLEAESTKTLYARYFPQKIGQISDSALLIMKTASGDLRLPVSGGTSFPEIMISDEKEVYDFPVNMWVDQTEEWNTFLESLGITVTDDGGKTVDSFQPGTTTPSGIICSAEYPDVAAEYPRSGLLDTLSCTEESQFLTVYNYNNPLAFLNTKTVILKAEDVFGNIVTKPIRIFLKDTVPPEIEEAEITVPFDVESFSYKWKDNSGLRKTETVTVGDYADYGKMSLIEGRFPVSVSFADNSGLKTEGSVFVTVLPPSQENCFMQGNFEGTGYAGQIGDTGIAGLECVMPSDWTLTQGFWTCEKPPYQISPSIDSLVEYEELTESLLCGALRSQNGVTAYATGGFRYLNPPQNSNYIANVSVTIQTTCETTLYDSVVYRVSFDTVDYLHDETVDLSSDSTRFVTLTKERGTGTLNGASKHKFEWKPLKPSGTDTISALMRKKSGEDIAVNAEWRTVENDFTVRDGNIDAFIFFYSVIPSYSNQLAHDYGTLISDIRIFAVNWNKLQPDGTVAPANAN